MSLSIFLNHVFSNSTQYLNFNFLCSPSLKLFPSLSLSPPPQQILKIVFTFEVVAFGDAAVAASAAAAFAVAASESVDDEEYA